MIKLVAATRVNRQVFPECNRQRLLCLGTRNDGKFIFQMLFNVITAKEHRVDTSRGTTQPAQGRPYDRSPTHTHTMARLTTPQTFSWVRNYALIITRLLSLRLFISKYFQREITEHTNYTQRNTHWPAALQDTSHQGNWCQGWC